MNSLLNRKLLSAGIPGAAALIVLTLLALVSSHGSADAQVQFHGAIIQKQCASPARIGGTSDCRIRVSYNDGYGDTIRITEGFDTVFAASGDVRVPASGSLPIDSISGNAACSPGPAVPCVIGPSSSTSAGLPGADSAGKVTFRSDSYVIQPGDPDPLADQGTAVVHDLCDAPATFACASIDNFIQFTAATDLINPHTTLTAAANPTGGQAPLTVNYTYRETNDSAGTATPVSISNVALSDSVCSPVAFQGGDANSNGLLDQGETWVFGCAHLFSGPGTYASSVTATGLVTNDQSAAPPEFAAVSVTVTEPPPTPTPPATPTPTPATPTPTALASTQTPKPTPTALPAALPRTGGEPSGGTPWPWILLAAGAPVIIIGLGSFRLARKRARADSDSID